MSRCGLFLSLSLLHYVSLFYSLLVDLISIIHFCLIVECTKMVKCHGAGRMADVDEREIIMFAVSVALRWLSWDGLPHKLTHTNTTSTLDWQLQFEHKLELENHSNCCHLLQHKHTHTHPEASFSWFYSLYNSYMGINLTWWS